MKLVHHAIGQAIGLLIYAALDDKIRQEAARLSARGDVYDKGFADGYERALAERRGGGPRQVMTTVPGQR